MYHLLVPLNETIIRRFAEAIPLASWLNRSKKRSSRDIQLMPAIYGFKRNSGENNSRTPHCSIPNLDTFQNTPLIAEIDILINMKSGSREHTGVEQNIKVFAMENQPNTGFCLLLQFPPSRIRLIQLFCSAKLSSSTKSSNNSFQKCSFRLENISSHIPYFMPFMSNWKYYSIVR